MDIPFRTKFGELTVLERDLSHRGRNKKWLCRCICGEIISVIGSDLRRGHSSRCVNCRNANNVLKKHGHAVRGKLTLTYQSWRAMRTRCIGRNPHKDYEGRGIAICARWNSFSAFLEDMGERPSKELTLDRKNNDGNYNKRNCRWATKQEQRNNQRRQNNE